MDDFKNVIKSKESLKLLINTNDQRIVNNTQIRVCVSTMWFFWSIHRQCSDFFLKISIFFPKCWLSIK